MPRIEPTELTTDRLILTPLVVEDASAMVAVLADPSLYVYTGGSPPTVEDLTRRYRAQVAGSGIEAEVWHNWVLRLAHEGTAIGFVQTTVTAEQADMAWVIGVDWQGDGFAKEAVAAMSEWLVGIGITRLTAHVHPDHRASQGVAKSAGLVRTTEIDEDGEEIWERRVELL